MKIGATPRPRKQVANKMLQRPDWTGSETRDPSKLWLDKNENTDPVMTSLLMELVCNLPLEICSTYPDLGPIYDSLSTHAEIATDRLYLAAGSDGVIRTIFEAFIAPGDIVIHTRPTFAMYGVYCQIFGATALPLDYTPSQAGPLLETETVIKAINNSTPRLVCLPNPDSPTGTVFAPKDLRAIIEAAGAVGAVTLIDEAYFPFYAETALPWIEEYPHLVVTRSFGKAWAAAGLRVGFAAAAPELAQTLHKVRPMYEIGALSAAILHRLLEHEETMRASVDRLNAGKRIFQGSMMRLPLRIYESHGNFMHVAFGPYAKAVHSALAPLVYYREDFSEPCLKGFSRFSTTTAELIEPIIRTIEITCHNRTKN